MLIENDAIGGEGVEIDGTDCVIAEEADIARAEIVGH